MINFRPTSNRIILTQVERPKIKNGIILPESDTNPWSYGAVEAKGPDTKVEIGDIILFYKCDATPLEIDGVLYSHIKQDHVIGTYSKEENNA